MMGSDDEHDDSGGGYELFHTNSNSLNEEINGFSLSSFSYVIMLVAPSSTI